MEATLDYWADGVATFDPTKVAIRFEASFPEAQLVGGDRSLEEVRRVAAYLRGLNASVQTRRSMMGSIRRKARDNGPVYSYRLPYGKRDCTVRISRYSVHVLQDSAVSTELKRRIMRFLESLQFQPIRVEGSDSPKRTR